MKGQQPVTATSVPSTTLAISFVLKFVSLLYICTKPATKTCTVPALAHATLMTSAIRPTVACIAFSGVRNNDFNSNLHLYLKVVIPDIFSVDPPLKANL